MCFFKTLKQPIWTSRVESQEAASLAQISHPPEVCLQVSYHLSD